MTRNLSPGKQALIFSILALAFGLALTPLCQTIGEPGLMLYMLTPSLAVLVMLFVVTREGHQPGIWSGLGLRPSGRGYWPVAILAAAVVSVAGLLVALVLPSAHYVMPDHLYLLPLNLVTQLIVVSATLTLGEELGWRGYLLPRLRHLGDTKAMLILGVIHGTWHMPIILLTTVDYINGDRLLIVPLFYLTIIGGSFFFGLLRIYSNSVWPASIAHAAHNAMWTLTGSFMVSTGFTATSYVAGDAGIVIAIGTWMGAGGLWLWHRNREKRLETRVVHVAVATTAPQPA